MCGLIAIIFDIHSNHIVQLLCEFANVTSELLESVFDLLPISSSVVIGGIGHSIVEQIFVFILVGVYYFSKQKGTPIISFRMVLIPLLVIIHATVQFEFECTG